MVSLPFPPINLFSSPTQKATLKLLVLTNPLIILTHPPDNIDQPPDNIDPTSHQSSGFYHLRKTIPINK